MSLLDYYRRGNEWLAVKITNGVGSMTCAWVFAAFAISGARTGIKTLGFNNWFAEEFLQLVLLSVIIVGQNIQAAKHDQLHSKVDALHTTVQTLKGDQV